VAPKVTPSHSISHPAFHRPTGDVELADVRLKQRRLALVGAELHAHRGFPDVDQHVAVEEEAQRAEHLLLLDALLTGTSRADARSPEFMQTPLVQNLRWLRVPGDTVFFLGAVALVVFVAGLKTGHSFRKVAEPQ
jgi:hypothetical protein